MQRQKHVSGVRTCKNKFFINKQKTTNNKSKRANITQTVYIYNFLTYLHFVFYINYCSEDSKNIKKLFVLKIGSTSSLRCCFEIKGYKEQQKQQSTMKLMHTYHTFVPHINTFIESIQLLKDSKRQWFFSLKFSEIWSTFRYSILKSEEKIED